MTSTEKKKGGRRLFSFLGCCGTDQIDDGTGNADTDLPPKPLTTTEAENGRLPTPAVEKPKEETNGSPENTVTNEKVEPTASQEKSDSPDAVVAEAAPSSAQHDGATVADTSKPTHDTQDQPPADDSLTPINHETEDASPIADRTPEQAKHDTDIEMTDAPPRSSIDVDEGAHSTHPHSGVVATLPPPPPLAEEYPPVPEAPEQQHWLLPPLKPEMKGRKCLVLDLDETLVHSSFKVWLASNHFSDLSLKCILTILQILNQADFTIPVEIEGQYHNVYVIKRPGVDQFMKRVGELYEVVVFTASVSKV